MKNHFPLRHALLLTFLAVSPLQANTFTVTRTNNTGPGSLPVIIIQANTTPGSQTIEFAVSGTITLVAPLPTITNSLTINGRVDSPVIISGGGTTPIFSFAAGTTNFMNQLSLINGSAANGGGAAINNAGTLLVTACQFTNNVAQNGGAIYNSGTLTVANSMFQTNQATLGFGGGIYNSGSLKISDTTLSANNATGGSGGAGAQDYTGGGGGGFGGGLFLASGSATVTNCTFSGNTAFGGSGGTYSGPSGYGGGNNGAGPGVSAGLGGGGWSNEVNGYGGGGGGGGGGSTESAFSPSFGQGGCWGNNGGGGGGAGLGAGVFIQNGALTLVNCTLTVNTCQGGAGGGGCPGIAGNSAGGGIFNLAGTVRLLNTIVAANTAFYWPGTANTYADLYGAFISSGFNLIGNNLSTTGLSSNDFQNVAASLGPLQDNGGPTPTCALLSGSLAIGAGTSIGAPLTDQRGLARPPGDCDIGAFQMFTVITPIIQWTNPADIVYGTPLGSSQLNATVGPAGTLTYSPPAGTVLSVGSNQLLQVVFTPTDPTQYTSATNSARINVIKADQMTATAITILENGFVVGATIANGGYGYTNTPTVRIISGDGTGAQAVAVMTNGVVIAVNILNAGYGYTNTPVIVIAPPFIPQPVMSASAVTYGPLVTPVIEMNVGNLSPYDRYQLEFSPVVTGAWTNLGLPFVPTATTNTQYAPGVGNAGYFRIKYVQ